MSKIIDTINEIEDLEVKFAITSIIFVLAYVVATA
jgi:hypothetical protein